MVILSCPPFLLAASTISAQTSDIDISFPKNCRFMDLVNFCHQVQLSVPEDKYIVLDDLKLEKIRFNRIFSSQSLGYYIFLSSTAACSWEIIPAFNRVLTYV